MNQSELKDTLDLHATGCPGLEQTPTLHVGCETALLGCHACDLNADCYFPFKPLRPGRCNGDKFSNEEQFEQYKVDMKEEREAEIRMEIRPPWSKAHTD